MQKSPIVRLRTPRLRRFVGLFTTLAYLIVCTGLPLPVVVGQDVATTEAGTTPYPCQGHRCGCRTAEQCWKSCCCMSDIEKRMWAERNGVPLPDYLLARVPSAAEPAQLVEHAVEAPARSCCKKPLSRSPAKPTTCSACPTEKVAHCAAPQNQTQAQSASTHVEWVSYLAAQRCSGGATDIWAAGPTSLPVASCLITVSRVEVVRPLVCASDEAGETAFSFPPRRPPRIA